MFVFLFPVEKFHETSPGTSPKYRLQKNNRAILATANLIARCDSAEDGFREFRNQDFAILRIFGEKNFAILRKQNITRCFC